MMFNRIISLFPYYVMSPVFVILTGAAAYIFQKVLTHDLPDYWTSLVIGIIIVLIVLFKYTNKVSKQEFFSLKK